MKKTSHRLLIVLGAVLLLALPAAAFGATSVWDDVPDDSIFVDYTNWMKTSGLSTGCQPPTNNYCPQDFVKRQQMAVFMNRLAVNRIVDAGWLEGYTADELMSTTASASATNTPVDDDATLITSITDFQVPNMGGVITAHANATAQKGTTDQLGVIWIEIDGDGSCSNVGSPGNVAWYYVPLPLIADSANSVSTAAVPQGPIDIDLCAGGAGTVDTSISGHITATWTPHQNTASVAGSSVGMTWAEFTALYPEVFGG